MPEAPIVCLGELAEDLDTLAGIIGTVPLDQWQYRQDPESDRTCVIREGHASWPLVMDEIGRILEKVSLQFFTPGYVNRVVLSCVPAGEEILLHTDDFGAEVSSRSFHCHLPVVTHETVIMGAGEPAQEVHLCHKHVYCLDATQRHYVRNPSHVDRVHLLFAYFPHAGKYVLS